MKRQCSCKSVVSWYKGHLVCSDNCGKKLHILDGVADIKNNYHHFKICLFCSGEKSVTVAHDVRETIKRKINDAWKMLMVYLQWLWCVLFTF